MRWLIVLSARTEEQDKIAALDAGADDYLTKPFGVGELLARLRAQFRRRSTGGGNAGKVITHRQLLREVWGPSHVDSPHYLRVYMGNLRKKLERDPAMPNHLLTESGLGYRFKP